MPTSPRVSVLLTSYNREDYVAAAIESVLAQTMTDFELIVSDDHSSDGTVDIVRDYASRDSRIRVSVNERNVGDYANRRRAANLAHGRYLKYHDSDDVMYAHCLATMVDLLEREPRAAFAMSGLWPGGPCPMLLTPRLAYEREFLGSGLFQHGPAAALFRTEAFTALGGFPEVEHSGDYLFWVRACTTAHVLLVPGDLFYYRTHPGQEIAKLTNELAQARASAQAWRMLCSAQCPLTPDTREVAKRNFVFTQARGVYRHLKKRRLRSAAMILRYVGPGVGEWLSYLRPPRRDPNAGTPALEEPR
jgi:hypothetical protein